MQVRELSSTLKNVKLKNVWDCNDIAKDTVFQNKISKALQNLVNKEWKLLPNSNTSLQAEKLISDHIFKIEETKGGSQTAPEVSNCTSENKQDLDLKK